MNIHLVLKAYERLERNLVVISNWKSSSYGKELYQKYHLNYNNILLLGPIYDSNELNYLRSNSSIYIHSHSLCGTAPSLVEAMSLGCACFCFDVSANRATTENKAEYFTSAFELEAMLYQVDSSALEKNSKHMYEIANRRYSWKLIGEKYRVSILKVINETK
jgi:glycosyltransferase involved in cell wall biosynthesis